MDQTQSQVKSGTVAAGAGAPDAQIDLTGKRLGDYQILRRLGQGGMGYVYLAEQISLKRKVALKLLRPEMAGNPISLQRFKSEALSAARATHANIVQIYDIKEADGLHFMALEYVEGRNLREYLEKKGPPEILVALSIMRQVASAIQRASELGIVHRDIKPENILVTRKGEVKVADFGLAPVLSDTGQPLNLTQTGVTMGTPLYMSPEQVEGKPLDFRTDIYSFGVTSYHLLAGQPPFRGTTPFEVALQHVQKEPPPLADIRPDLPPELCALVHRMMAKKPAERPQTGREIVRELIALRDAVVGVTSGQSGSGIRPVPLGAAGAPATAPVPGLSASGVSASGDALSGLPRPPRRGRRALVLAGSLILALAAGLVVGWIRGHGTERANGVAVDPASANPQRAREAALKKKLDDDADVNAAIDLGLLYLKERPPTKADKFFTDLRVPKKEPLSTLGALGHAMVLAYQDQPSPSNRAFLSALTGRAVKKDKSVLTDDKLTVKSLMDGNASLKVLLESPPLRETIADALQHNYVNMQKKGMPPILEKLRKPWVPNVP
jgi:eukaryotic-like serine/threonine-protein kinase